MEDPQSRAVIENNMTGSFNINVGVRRGETLSAILLNLVDLLDYILNKSYVRENI